MIGAMRMALSPRSGRAVALVLLTAFALLPPRVAEGDTRVAAPASTFAAIADVVRPAVVHVSATAPEPPDRASSGALPTDRFMYPSITDVPDSVRGRRRGLGSGVIVDASGLVVTNAHVVGAAREVEVMTFDGRRHIARVLGVDRVTDLAALRLAAAPTAYPFLALGDSDTVRVGDWVLAVGSPFGLDATVTAGIISARARHLGAGPFDDFLQTDAAINPGNSGGPLIDMEGRVIGINTIIAAQGSGIGFAIPSNLVRRTTAQLAAHGVVPRGRLGLAVQPLTPALAKVFGVAGVLGVLVADVSVPGPAARAGIRPGDIVLSLDGEAIATTAALQRAVALTAPGQTVSLSVRREGSEHRVAVTLADADGGIVTIAPSRPGPSGLGFDVQAVTVGVARRLGLRDAHGVVVTAVAVGGEAEAAGLRPGDVIREIARRPVRTMGDFRRLTRSLRRGEAVAVRAERSAEPFFAAITVR